MRQRIAFAVVTGLLLMVACSGVDFVAREGTTVVVSANPGEIRADGGVSNITAVLTTNGLPAPDGTVVRFTTTVGTITASDKTEDGLAHAVLVSDGESGSAAISAFSGAFSGETTIAVGVAATGLSLAATPASLPTGGGTVSLVATLFGADGFPVEGASVAFSTSEGSLESGGNPTLTDADGVVTDKLETTQSADVTATAGTVSGESEGGGTVSDSVTIAVGASEVSSVVLSASPVNLPASGGVSQLVAVVLGPSGPIPGVAVAWSNSNGTLSTGGVVITDSDGKATNSLDTKLTSDVTASAAGASGNVTVTVGDTGDVFMTIAAERGSIPAMDVTGGGGTCSGGPEPTIRLVAQMQDSLGQPVNGREVQFFIDFSLIFPCDRVFGEFCDNNAVCTGAGTPVPCCTGAGSGSCDFVTAKTDSTGTAEVLYVMTDEDIAFCNCLPPTGPDCRTTSPGICPAAACGVLCIPEPVLTTDPPAELKFCKVGISAISGNVLSTNGIVIEYGR